MAGIQVRDVDEAATHLTSHEVRLDEIERRLRIAEKKLDTGWETPLWKRLVFWLDGWPLHRLVMRPAWRPWRHWWTS